ncbi:MAG: glutamate synthase large subunit [Lachnospiraceae bacterium]|nr:glutamate synthase large subunit [Lachnospiraceae bacterium]
MKEEERRRLLSELDGGQDSCGIGAVVNIDGKKENRTIDDALSIVERLEHRAGKDASGKVGDGVGILTQISHSFFEKAAKDAGIEIGGEGDYGIGMLFFPTDEKKRTFSMRMLQVITEKNGMEFLGYRQVPVHPEILGDLARDSMPAIYQCFIKKPADIPTGLLFDKKLYVTRREFEQSAEDTYICSFSSRTIVYKGMFLVKQLRAFYDDLQSPDMKSAIALVHSRFSTNTTPSWERAHPYRMICHNGEINTIKGNIDRMLAREETMAGPYIDENADKIFPVIGRIGSDSAMLDNTFEFFCMNGMDPALAIMTLIPESWKNDSYMSREKKDFYHYYATMMEPWDGPAAILFSDGDIFGATLDRNGLRPSRYYITDDNRLILSSEVGVLDIAPEHIVKKSRLTPGRILLVDTKKGRLISDDECKKYYSEREPYGEWLATNLKHLVDVPVPNKKLHEDSREQMLRLCKVFGYTYEQVRDTILPMAENAVEPTASMGHDVPLAVLSEHHELLFSYFKQMFAQVTNPPIDSLREKIVTDTTIYIGSDGNLLSDDGANCRVLEVDNPILTGTDMLKIESLDEPGLRAKVIPVIYYRNTSLKKALDQLMLRVDRAAAKGFNIVILSDRGVDENHVPIPSLLAVSAVEQHLVRTKKRTAVSLIIESAEPRDVHQTAALLSFGARAVYPYLAHECIAEMIREGTLDKDYHTAIDDYNQALLKGIVKVAAKMGISTLQSYQSARIFEAVGLSKEVTDEYFTGTVSRVGGIGLDEIAEGVNVRHTAAFDPLGLATDTTLDSPGYHRQFSGDKREDHLFNPYTIITLQRAVRNNDYEEYRKYTDMTDNELPHTLRGLLQFNPVRKPIPLSDVEPEEEIVKRFQTGAMSFGSLSREAHETMAIAMNRLGGRSNTGEGGEDPARYGTEANSAVKQVASARFGVTSEYLNSGTEIQIKVAQGAKPGEGGHLPGKKVYPIVAKIRYSTPGVALISPPPHHDIYSIEDLAELIYDLKNANPDARISVKLVSEHGVGTIACGVAKAGAQVILISGFDGGTGAAPITSIHNTGLPWELGLAEANRALKENNLRDRVILETDGKLVSGKDVAIACLLGAEEFGFATAVLVSMGCMMMRVCSKDTCPVGIATQNECLRGRFKGRPEDVMNFMLFTARQLREIMASLGFKTIDDMVGHSECLAMKEHQITHIAETVDLSNILKPAAVAGPSHFEPEKIYDFHLDKTIDEAQILPAMKLDGKPHTVKVEVNSPDRALGSLFGSQVTRKFKSTLPDDTYTIEAVGGAGQSLGGFLPKGVTIRLTGDANDGVGKGLSGGKIVIVPPKKVSFEPATNIIIGNVALYGATAGKLFINGVAGERFCVRNSGATAVATGCGDHGLEYMTGGRAVILGPVGRNFAAGMSGGIAYVLDPDHSLYTKLNMDMVTMEPLSEKADMAELKEILEEFVKETDSEVGKKVLSDFDTYLPSFKKIMPNDYRKILSVISRYEEKGFTRAEAEEEAFREIAG